MYRKGPQGWLKHLDFTVLNLIALHASYCMAYFIRMGTENPYHSKLYRTIAILLTLFQLLVTIVCHIYKGVLQRGRFREAIASVKQSVLVVLLAVFILFMMKMGAAYSRKVMALFGMIYRSPESDPDLSGYGLCGYTPLEGIYTKTSCSKEIYCNCDS